MLPGLITVFIALAVATGVGVAWRRRNGTFRPARSTAAGTADDVTGRPARGSALPTASGPATVTAAATPDPAASWPEVLTRLGVTPGTPVTLVQFSSAFCAPCRATRLLCTDVAAAIPGVRHVEVDAESHLTEVRELDIWKTPTLLLVDADGRERLRATGLPTRSQLVVAIGSVLAPAADTPVA